jgi:AraC-like DNA-binding protein
MQSRQMTKTDAHDSAQSEIKIPRSILDTRGMAPKLAAAAWIERIQPVFDSRLRQAVEGPIDIRVDSYCFSKDMILGSAVHPGIINDRSAYRIGRDGRGHYMLIFVLSGEPMIDRRQASPDYMTPGDIFVCDLNQPQMLVSGRCRTLTYGITRERLAPLLKAPDAHNMRVLRGENNPLARLLLTHTLSLHENGPDFTPIEAETLTQPTLDLIAALLNGAPHEATHDGVAAVLFDEIRRHIDQRLFAADLSAQRIAEHFGMSVRKLFYLFEAMGGVAAYVQERRLHRARIVLMDTNEAHRTIADIAEGHGFSQRTVFIKAFRRHYGMAPSEVRSLALEREDARRRQSLQRCWAGWR